MTGTEIHDKSVFDFPKFDVGYLFQQCLKHLTNW